MATACAVAAHARLPGIDPENVETSFELAEYHITKITE